MVSITPTVLLAVVPPEIKNRGALIGGKSSRTWEFSYGGRIPTQSLYYGTRTFYNEGMQWFSPDLERQFTDLNFSPEGIAEIKLPDGRLKVVRDGHVCNIVRE